MMPNAPSIGRLQISRDSGSVALGKYHVFASLGRGGMADVKLAAVRGPKGFQKLVVVKRLRPLLAEDAAIVNMFLDEARLDARLNHPNLIHTYEFGEEEGTYFIVMEFLEGQSLSELLHAARARRRGSPVVWAKIIADALAGLHYAHELSDYDGTPLRIVHRDVSPQNIVVTYDGAVKLVDFGVAKAAVNAAKTESQMIKGKLAYMAPEQVEPIKGTPLDRRADVFSMGIVLWECLTGKRLASGENPRTVMEKILKQRIPAPSEMNSEVPPELDAIVLRALDRSITDRYQTAQAMREALEKLLRTHGEMVDETTIGALVTGLFAHEREDMKRQIHVQMLELGPTRDLTVKDSTPSQRIARRAALAAATAAAASPSPAGAAADAAQAADAHADAPGVPRAESAGSLRAVRTSVPIDGRGARGRWIAVAMAAALMVTVAAFVSWRSARTGAAGAGPVGVAQPIPAMTATQAASVASPGAAGAEPTPSPTPTEAVVPVTAGSASVEPAAPPASSAGAATPGATRPPTFPQRTAPTKGSRPPKLEDDPWR
jgi:serine/threonine protein kinase